MKVEIRKVQNGYLIKTVKESSSGVHGYQPEVIREYIATSLDSVMDKLREVLK